MRIHNFNLLQSKLRKQRIAQRTQYGVKIYTRAKHLNTAVKVLHSFKWDENNNRKMYSPLCEILQRRPNQPSIQEPLTRPDSSVEKNHQEKFHEVVNTEIRSCIKRVFSSEEPICSIISRRIIQKTDELESISKFQSKPSPSSQQIGHVFTKTVNFRKNDSENVLLKTNSAKNLRMFSYDDQENEFHASRISIRTSELNFTPRSKHYDIIFPTSAFRNKYSASNGNVTPNSFLQTDIILPDDFSLKSVLASERRFNIHSNVLNSTNHSYNRVLMSDNISEEILDEQIKLSEFTSPVTSTYHRNYRKRKMSIYSGDGYICNYTSLFDGNLEVCGYDSANYKRKKSPGYEEDIFSYSFVNHFID